MHSPSVVQHRLFFALWPEDALRDAVMRTTRKLVRRSGGRPVVAANVHVTLVFLGGVAAGRVVQIERISAAVTAPAFELVFDRLEYWPRPRVLCLTASTPPPALYELVQALSEGLTAQGFELERRPYRAHLTLARKVARPLDYPSPVLPWPARDFVLVESKTSEEGARYQVIGRWPLIAADRGQ